MPHTINGIGTWQYGKKNLETRVGVCELCHRNATLQSYDTREYFVIFFIPIIPLGAYHNIDHCSLCRRWKALKKSKWEELTGTHLQKALQAYADNPSDFDSAWRLYNAYIFFQRLDDSRKMLAHIREQFADDPARMSTAGEMSYRNRQFDDARQFFERSLALKADDVRTQCYLVSTLASLKKIDEAKTLFAQVLRSEMKNADIFSGGMVLLDEMVQAKRHDDVLKLAAELRQKFPEVTRDAKFRKDIRDAEKATGVRNSSLPREPIAWTKFAIPAILLAVALLAFGINEYRRTHAPIYIISGLPKPVTVLIDGQTYTVNTNGTTVAHVAEGQHQVKVLGEAAGELSITVKSGIRDRLFGQPAYVIDVAGSVPLNLIHVVYSQSSKVPSTSDYHLGEQFFTYSDVDYLFDTPPTTITLDKGGNNETKTYLKREALDQIKVVIAIASRQKFMEAFELAKVNLLMNRQNSSEMLRYLVTVSKWREPHTAALEFLKEECRRRPVEPEFHRTYQEMALSEGKLPELVQMYESLVKEFPSNPDLLCLRGNVCDGATQAEGYAERAKSINPKHAAAHDLLGTCAMARGDFARAVIESNIAHELAPENKDYARRNFLARVAARDLPAPDSVNTAQDEWTLEQIVYYYATQRDLKPLLNFYEKTQQRLMLNDSGDQLKWAGYPKELAAYNLGILDQSKAPPTMFRVAYALQRGDPDTAAAAAADWESTFAAYLTIAQAFGKAHLLEKSDDNRMKALAMLPASEVGGAQLVKLMQDKDAPTINEVLNVMVDPASKALALIDLADRHSEMAAKYLELAKKLNANVDFPHREIESAIQKREH